MSDTDTRSRAELRAEKLIRRQKRNLRKAEAEGFLDGVCAMLRPGDVVFDCGANQGVVTERLAATGADVIAYEPDPWAFAQLSTRFGDSANVTLVQAAVARDAGTVTLRRAGNFDANPSGASVKSTILDGGRSVDDSTGIDVPCLSFSAEVAKRIGDRPEIAFVKMDIEGAELEILEDLVARDAFGAIRCLVAETHERKFKALRDRFRILRETVRDRYPVKRVNLDWI